MQALDPRKALEAVGELLGVLGVVELGEGVVLLHEADASLMQFRASQSWPLT
jgi:hypothetical protein